MEKIATNPQVVKNPGCDSGSALNACSTPGNESALMNWKMARNRPPRAASNTPAPLNVRSLRSAVTSKPHPVALSTAAGTSDVAGCVLRCAAIAKTAAMMITTPTANQSKRT